MASRIWVVAALFQSRRRGCSSSVTHGGRGGHSGLIWVEGRRDLVQGERWRWVYAVVRKGTVVAFEKRGTQWWCDSEGEQVVSG